MRQAQCERRAVDTLRTPSIEAVQAASAGGSRQPTPRTRADVDPQRP